MSDYTEHLISMAGGDGEPDALDLDAIQARADAATEGPWEVEPRTDDEMVYEGEECSMCAAGKPLVTSENYPAEVGHKAYSMHRHAAEPHHVNGPANVITGNYDYEEGGILRGADAVFIAHARTDVPALLAIVREQAANLERVEALHQPVVVYELDPENGTWIYDGDERRVLATLCGECTPEFVLGEIEDGDYDGSGSDADVQYPCPTIAALTATEGA